MAKKRVRERAKTKNWATTMRNSSLPSQESNMDARPIVLAFVRFLESNQYRLKFCGQYVHVLCTLGPRSGTYRRCFRLCGVASYA